MQSFAVLADTISLPQYLWSAFNQFLDNPPSHAIRRNKWTNFQSSQMGMAKPA